MAHNYYLTRWSDLSFLILFLLFGKQLLFLLGGRGEILQESYSYCSILFFGGILLWLSGSLSAVLRGMGNMRFPATLMVITSSNTGHIIRRIYSWMVWLSKIGCARCGSSCANFQCPDGYCNFIQTKI